VLFLGGLAATTVLVPSGLLSDRYRRRNIIVLSSIISGVAALYLTTVKSWGQSVPGIALFSAAFSMFIPASQTMVADNTEPGRMAATYSFMNASWPIGAIIGPVLGGFLAENYGWNYTFYVAALASLLSIAPTYYFKRTYRGDKRRDRKKEEIAFFGREVLVLLIIFSLFQIFLNGAIGIMDPLVPIYLTERFHVSETAVGFFFSMGLGVATLLAQIPSGILADRYDRRRILTFIVLPLPFIMLLWPLMGNYPLLMMLYMFIVGLWSMTWASASAYLMSLTPVLKRGLVISIRQTAVRIGFTIGPPIGGYFWYANPTIPFYVSAVFFALSLFNILLLKKPEKKLRPKITGKDFIRF